MILATAILIIPAITAKHAKQDAWLSSLLAMLLGLPIAWLTTKLSSLYPGKTFIEITEEVLGRWLGKALGLLYLLWLIHICSVMIREYGDFLTGAFMPATPLIIFHIVVVVIAAYTVKQGLEVLARVNEIFLPLIIFSMLLIILLALPQMDFTRLLPIFKTQPVDIFKGSMVTIAWYSEITTFAMIIPFLNRPGDAKRIAIISILITGLFFTLLVIAALAVLGTGVAALTYPVLSLVRLINIANVLERLEPIIMAIWVTWGFVKITLFYYVIVLGSAQLLKLNDYRPLVMPVGVTLVALSIAIAENILEMLNFISNTVPFYFLFTFGAGILLVLFIIAIIMGRGGKGYN